MAATDTPHVVRLLQGSRYQVNNTPQTILEYSRHTLISHIRLEKAMACPLVRRDVPPTIVITPAPEGDSVEAQLPVQIALDLDRLSPLLPSHTQRPETDTSIERFSFAHTISLAKRALDGMTNIIAAVILIVFCVFPHMFMKNGAPSSLVGFIFGVIGLFCLTHVVLRNYAKKLWLRVNCPESQDRRHGFWNGVASIVALASSVDQQRTRRKIGVVAGLTLPNLRI